MDTAYISSKQTDEFPITKRPYNEISYDKTRQIPYKRGLKGNKLWYFEKNI